MFNGVIGVAFVGEDVRPDKIGEYQSDIGHLDVAAQAQFSAKMGRSDKRRLFVMPCIRMSGKSIDSLKESMLRYVNLICENMRKVGKVNERKRKVGKVNERNRAF